MADPAEEMVDNVWDESPGAPLVIPKSEHERNVRAERAREESAADMFSAKARAARERDAQDRGMGR